MPNDPDPTYIRLARAMVVVLTIISITKEKGPLVVLLLIAVVALLIDDTEGVWARQFIGGRRW